MEDDLKFWENGRPSPSLTNGTTLIYSKMEDHLNFSKIEDDLKNFELTEGWLGSSKILFLFIVHFS